MGAHRWLRSLEQRSCGYRSAHLGVQRRRESLSDQLVVLAVHVYVFVHRLCGGTYLLMIF